MDNPSVNSVGTALARTPEPDRTVTPGSREQRNATLAVSNAARQLNEIGFAGQGREITFTMDPGTRRPTVKIIDSSTREVLEQWPSDYLLQIAKSQAAPGIKP